MDSTSVPEARKTGAHAPVIDPRKLLSIDETLQRIATARSHIHAIREGLKINPDLLGDDSSLRRFQTTLENLKSEIETTSGAIGRIVAMST